MTDEESYSFRRLIVCLSRCDWRAFGDAVAETFPHGKYYYEPMVFFGMFRVPPPVFHGDHMFRIDDLDPERLPEAQLHFDPHWKIEWSRPDPGDREAVANGKSNWSLRQPRLPTFRFEFGFHTAAERGHPEHLTSSQLWFFFAEGNREHFAIGHQLMRVFRQFATNKAQAILQGPERRIKRVYKAISPYWLGRHAIEWAMEDESRLLNYRRFNDPQRCWGIRPQASE